jgi:hypothetical protein
MPAKNDWYDDKFGFPEDQLFKDMIKDGSIVEAWKILLKVMMDDGYVSTKMEISNAYTIFLVSSAVTRRFIQDFLEGIDGQSVSISDMREFTYKIAKELVEFHGGGREN